jgi:methylated-DNA-[protein]-cysteine S-methyltransferase
MLGSFSVYWLPQTGKNNLPILEFYDFQISCMTGLAYYSSPVGELLIESEDDKIVTLNFLKDSKQQEFPTVTTEQCIAELDEYFYKGRKFFSVELNPKGTEFQQSVWNELLNIPYGKTISYEALALRLGNIKSIRAVGLANGQNPIAIIIPCHRVIGKSGELVGYGGGLENKEWLLYHEGAILKQLTLF